LRWLVGIDGYGELWNSDTGVMSQDGKDPPTLEPGAKKGRPNLRVIAGGAGIPSEPPEMPALARAALSPEGHARVLRALRMLGAERAFLFVWDEHEFTLNEACACDESGKEPTDRSVMWSLLDRITSQRTPLVMAGTDDQPTDAMMSGITAPMRMAVAVPLLGKDILLGVTCFDKRIHKGQFVVSDAYAAALILHELGVDAKELPALQNGGAAPKAQTVQARDVLARLRDVLGPKASQLVGMRASAQLCAPSDDALTYWHAQTHADGTERTILCRLVHEGVSSDVLVNRYLSAVRTFSVMADGNMEDQLRSMSFELERAHPSAFQLHVTAFELAPDEPHVTIWHAGTGSALAVSPTGESRPLLAPTAPLGRGGRELARDRHTLLRNEQLVCALGSTAIDLRERLPAHTRAVLSGRAAQLHEQVGPAHSIWWFARDGAPP
jgi:hypothetical protein